VFLFLPENKLNMKHLFAMFLFAAAWAAPFSLNAQTKAPWKQMHDFHTVMSATFHGAEEGNLIPLKERAGELVQKSKEWQKSAVPSGYNPKLTKDTLKRLTKQCKDVEKAVKAKKSDKELTAGITKAHDIFHEIMEKCQE
jgi:hypothetical protein